MGGEEEKISQKQSLSQCSINFSAKFIYNRFSGEKKTLGIFGEKEEIFHAYCTYVYR